MGEWALRVGHNAPRDLSSIDDGRSPNDPVVAAAGGRTDGGGWVG